MWGAHEAAALGCELRLVTAVPDYVTPSPHFSTHTEDRDVLDMLAGVRDEVRGIADESLVHTAAVGGDAVDVLLEEAASAALVVVGKRGLGGFSRLIVGSTSIALAARSPAPVAIVPDRWDTAEREGGPVVLGVDLDKPDDEPIEVGFHRAQRLGVAFGSVARAVLHYADCPVVVVPSAESKRRHHG